MAADGSGASGGVPPTRGLHLFSGPYRRAGGFWHHAAKHGLLVDEVDRAADPSGADLLDDVTYESYLGRAERGEYAFVLAGVPCDTWSVARLRSCNGTPARPLRDRRQPYGFSRLPAADRRRVNEANELARRALTICLAVHRTGGTFVLEHPVDRGGGPHRVWELRLHAPIWCMDIVQEFALATAAASATFPQCAFSAPWQKFTTILYSSVLDDSLGPLHELACEHPHGHAGGRAVGFDEQGVARSAAASAYPSALNATFVRAFAAFVFGSRVPPSTPRSRAAAGQPVPRDEARDLEILAAAEPPKFPKEVKMAIPELMSDMAILQHMARLVAIGEYFNVSGDALFAKAAEVARGDEADVGWLAMVEGIFQLGDDYADWFYQLRLAALDRHKTGFITLAFEKEGEGDPELRFVVEKVLGQGTFPGSNWGQRFADLVLFIFRRNLAELAAPAIAAARAARPALDTVLRARERLSEQTGRDEALLSCCAGYTDDTHATALGAPLFKLVCRAWDTTTSRIGLLMADAEKRQVGSHIVSLGICLVSSLGVAYVPEDKAVRALTDLQLLCVGQLAVDLYRSLLGLLQHVLFLADMRRSAMYGMYTPLLESGAIADGPATLVTGEHLTPLIVRQAQRWSTRLASGAGAPFTAAVVMLSRAPLPSGAPMRVYWRSDAAKEGALLPAVAGVMGGRYWRRRFSARELRLPIAVLEFVGDFGNYCVFAALVPAPIAVVRELDALASPSVLASDAARSPLMQHVHTALLALPGYDEFASRSSVAHVFGAANPLADAWSRGNDDVALQLSQQLGLSPIEFDHPPQLDELLDELCALQDSLPAAREPPPAHCESAPRRGKQRRRSRARHSTTLGMHNPCMTGSPFAQYTCTAPCAAPSPALPVVSACSGKRALFFDSAAAVPAPLAKVLFVGAVATGLAAVAAPPAAVACVAAAAVATVPPIVAASPRLVVCTPRQAVGPIISWSATADQATGAGDVLAAGGGEANGFARAVASALSADASAFALRPRDPTALLGLCTDIYDDAYDNSASRKKLDGNMRHWSVWCAEMGTPMWRPDFRSLSVGDQRRETILAAGFLPWLLRRMRARRSNGRALPASAFKVWLGVRKVHQKRDIGLSPSKVITATVKRLCRKHIKDFGAASLIPKRKEPFTRAMILALLRLADGLRIGPYVLTWDSRVGRALRALIVVLASTGMRKAEVSISSGERFDKTHVSRADLRWRLRGRVYVSPPANLLAAPQPGDCVMLKPPLSKADPFGAVWGASPIYLSYEPNDPLCAFSALAAVEIHDPVDARENTPLLSPDGASPFLAGHLDTMLRAMLVVTVGAAEATKFSWHSMRIWLACSLLASGASHAQIQALCRWRSDEALAIYARLNQTTYAALLRRALVADVNSVRMNQLPDVDAEDVFRSILTETDAEMHHAL